MFLFIKERKSNFCHFKHLNINYEMDPALFVLHLLAPAVTHHVSWAGQLGGTAQSLEGFFSSGRHQPLSDRFGATCGAAFCEAGAQVVMRKEQVG